jgi:hypothetical protein
MVCPVLQLLVALPFSWPIDTDAGGYVEFQTFRCILIAYKTTVLSRTVLDICHCVKQSCMEALSIATCLQCCLPLDR